MKNSVIKFGTYALVAVGLAGCSVGGSQDARIAERWRNFSSSKITAPAEHAASVVFLREEGALAGQSVNIFVNGEYLTSLLPGAYKQSIACVGNNRLTSQFTDVRTRYLEKERSGQYFDVPAGQITYFMVVPDPSGASTLLPLEAATARALVDGMKEQAHTLSRVDQTPVCEQPVVKPFKTFTLDASALFHFDKSDLSNMLPEGKSEIQHIVQQIRASHANIERIVVTGYTDPEGTAAYNQRLSERRAATVKRVMTEGGLTNQNIVASGRGETNLLVPDCRQRFPRDVRQRTVCDQPNRRVEIELFGSMANPVE
ncbi:MAG: OmpA family protein [Alcaligenaceae bacterium]|nr:OmpA family protein [Alcaligenaceae bacterium]